GHGVDHGLVVEIRLAEADDPVESCPETPGEVARRNVLVLAEGRAESQEERAVERSAGTADGRDQGAADLLEQRAGLPVPKGWQVLPDGGHPAVHVDAVVGITDGRVERRELVLRIVDAIRERI